MKANKIIRTFPVVDPVTTTERENLKFFNYESLYGQGVCHIVAVKTGEYRPVQRGEWYISGAIQEAYRAGGDWNHMNFWIAKLVVVRKVTRMEIVEE
jgi:hypothetical protein